MTAAKKINKLYLITRDRSGRLHHYVSSTAAMHFDILLQKDIDLDEHTILEKGFLHDGHCYTANYDIRGEAVRKQHENRRRGTEK